MPGRRLPPELCARCKGYKRLCGLPQCPILARFRAQVAAATYGKEVEGDTPPSLVVGESGYPHVNVMFQIPPGLHGDESKIHDAPQTWFKTRVKLEDIIELRSKLLAGTLRVRVDQPWVLYEREISIAAVSEKPVASELQLAKQPIPRLVFDGLTAPRGPSAPASKLRITSNPRPPRPLEKLFFDDMLASEAVVEAFSRGIDVYTIIRGFSAGLLGRLRSRKLVPTRWAITAVDSILGDWLRKQLADAREVSSFEVYKGYYLGNRFIVIVAPGGPRSLMIEIWHPSTPWVDGSRPVAITISEKPSGQPSSIDGGFMAARFAVYNALYEKRKRGTVFIIREILPEYYAPVGNWHIRETVYDAVKSKPVLITDDIDSVKKFVFRNIDVRNPNIRRRVEALIVRLVSQKRLDEWL